MVWSPAFSGLRVEQSRTSLCSASYVSCQRHTVRICCRAPCCWAPAVQQSVYISCPPGAQQQTRSSGVWWTTGKTDRRTNRRTDGCPTVTQILLRILCEQCPKCIGTLSRKIWTTLTSNKLLQKLPSWNLAKQSCNVYLSHTCSPFF